MKLLPLCMLFITAAAISQSSPLRRTVLLTQESSIAGREVIIAKVEIDAGGLAARHTHPGDEISYVAEGDVELLVDGEAPRRLKAGEAFMVPAGKVHAARNAGSTTARVIASYVNEKGKPLATPAP